MEVDVDMENEIRHLNEYNKSMMDKHKKEQAYELKMRQRPTNIKCEKCDGFYRHKDFYTIYASNPGQQLVVCVSCGDEQYIIV